MADGSIEPTPAVTSSFLTKYGNQRRDFRKLFRMNSEFDGVMSRFGTPGRDKRWPARYIK